MRRVNIIFERAIVITVIYIRLHGALLAASFYSDFSLSFSFSRSRTQEQPAETQEEILEMVGLGRFFNSITGSAGGQE